MSSGSRIEIKADVIVDGRESAANELGDGNNRSRMNGYDTEAGRHSMNQSQPRVSKENHKFEELLRRDKRRNCLKTQLYWKGFHLTFYR